MHLNSLQPSPSGLPHRRDADQPANERDPLTDGASSFPDPFALPAMAVTSKDAGFSRPLAEAPAEAVSEAPQPAEAAPDAGAEATPLSGNGPGIETAPAVAGTAMLSQSISAPPLPALSGKVPGPVTSAFPPQPPPAPEADVQGAPALAAPPAPGDASDPPVSRPAALIKPDAMAHVGAGLRQAGIEGSSRQGQGGQPTSGAVSDPSPKASLTPPQAISGAKAIGSEMVPSAPAEPEVNGPAETSLNHGRSGEDRTMPTLDGAPRRPPGPADSFPSQAVAGSQFAGAGLSAVDSEPGAPASGTSDAVQTFANGQGSAGVFRIRPLGEFATGSFEPTGPAALSSDTLAPSVAPLPALVVEGRQTLGASPALSSAPLPPQTQIAAMIVDQVRAGMPGLIEVSLSPIELGAIRFEMQQGPDGLHVHLAIERPETGDLVRRHVEQLLADLRTAGFAQTTLSFGQWSQRQPADRQAATLARGPFAGPGADPVFIQPALSASGRLHLRL